MEKDKSKWLTKRPKNACCSCKISMQYILWIKLLTWIRNRKSMILNDGQRVEKNCIIYFVPPLDWPTGPCREQVSITELSQKWKGQKFKKFSELYVSVWPKPWAKFYTRSPPHHQRLHFIVLIKLSQPKHHFFDIMEILEK